ncbi:MAG: carbon starvation protein A [Armatimonadetes bacterium]|nr:carbon starvation protein A [Armatimonadota bacterium]
MSGQKRQGTLIGIAIAGAVLVWAVSQFTHENFNAVSLLVAALSFYYLGGKIYSAFIADHVLNLDDANITPAHRHNDGHDHIPYKRWTLFGMHFAWIAGPGPLIGPTLAAQFGFLPGFLWIVLGAVLLGCVQDMVILAFSTRRDGMSLARMIKKEISPIGGIAASITILFILEILLAVLALFVVNALKGSPWATFTIFSSIPIAMLVGWYMTKFRPGHEGQATVIGVTLLIVSTGLGHWVAETPALAQIFTRTDVQLAWALVVYGFLAAALPAWLLLAPRDNISTYLKIGTVALLAVGIFFAQPTVKMPAITPFIDGSGPIFAGKLFPFCFIIIACGAISGFHSLISSGVTPRFVDKETDIRTVGYGAMLTESFVGVMALIAAVTLAPGVHLAMNIPKRANETPVQLTQRISKFGPAFQITTNEMDSLAHKMQEKSLYNRSGGGPSLAVGMASIFSRTLGGAGSAFWYHFAIMFEAVFILTVLDSGTRVIRFVIQEMLGDLKALRRRRKRDEAEEEEVEDAPSLANVPVWVTSGLAVLGWGLILSWGILDPEGGTKALIRMFGTANQMLSVIALTLATVIMLRKHRKFAWVTGIPMLIVGTITLTAGYQALFSSDPRLGAIATAQDAAKRVASGALPAKAGTIMMNNAYLTAVLTGILFVLVVTVLAISLREVGRQLKPAREGA